MVRITVGTDESKKNFQELFGGIISRHTAKL
jgi:hypothetical protein